MKEQKFRIVILEDGRLIVENLPVKKGQQVEVVVRIEEPSTPAFSLRGLPVRYKEPFAPATDESDWDALK